MITPNSAKPVLLSACDSLGPTALELDQMSGTRRTEPLSFEKLTLIQRPDAPGSRRRIDLKFVTALRPGLDLACNFKIQ